VPPERIKHFELLESVITRMAGNSFLIRGWTITLIAALFALAAKDADYRYILAGFFPVIFFWVLDAFYLRQDRLFRKLYALVLANAAAVPVLSMDTTPVAGHVKNWFRTLGDRMLLIFYGPMLLTLGVVLVFAYARPLAGH
jgi:hypothetical protein